MPRSDVTIENQPDIHKGRGHEQHRSSMWDSFIEGLGGGTAVGALTGAGSVIPWTAMLGGLGNMAWTWYEGSPTDAQAKYDIDSARAREREMQLKEDDLRAQDRFDGADDGGGGLFG